MDTEKIQKTVWDYYTRKGKDLAQCNNCNKILKAAGGSTSGLHAHLKSQHQVNLLKRTEPDVSASSSHQGEKILKAGSSRNILTNYFKKTVDDSLAAVISRMVARDGLPFKKFCSSLDLRKLLTDRGYIVPKSTYSIKKIVMEYGVKIRNEIRVNIADHMKKGSRFSLTFDEWTSQKNRRYMNINVHTLGNKFWNLGLTRVHGSMDANKCIQLVETKLEEFGLNFDNIVSITTDGVAVMKKVGFTLDTHHQLCLAHGIQLAVIEVVYKKNTLRPVSASDESNKEQSDEEQDQEEEDNDLAEGFGIEFDSVVESDVSHEDILPIITKIRQVVKLFRRSPTKNEILQQHVKNEFGKEISLILDSRTRWNSLLDMVERFYKLKSCARKSLIDLNIEISFSEQEINAINTIISSLLPVKLAVEALGAADCTLLNADVTLQFMLDELSTQNNTLSGELKNALIVRMQERRTSFSDVLQFLHNPVEFRNTYLADNYNLFKLNKTAIIKTIVSLIERLNKNVCELPNESSDDSATEVVELQLPLTMKERLQLAITEKHKIKLNEVNSESITTNNATLTKLIKKEIAILEEEKCRGKYLTLAFDYLLTIKPTSVESERAFSSAGLICTKIRTSLRDSTIDNICLLRAYFNAQKDLQN